MADVLHVDVAGTADARCWFRSKGEGSALFPFASPLPALRVVGCSGVLLLSAKTPRFL